MTGIGALVRQQFGAHADNYVRSTDHARSASLGRLVQLAEAASGWRVLDVATGGGHTALALAAQARQVIAIDLTLPMLHSARGFVTAHGPATVAFGQADAQALPFAASSFNLVTCRVAPHHFPDCGLFVREVARVLVPGGRVVLIDNVVPASDLAGRHINAIEKLRDPSYHWAYTEADWLAFFEAAGLAVTHTEMFRKTRDFAAWCDMLGVAEHRRAQLRVLLAQAPAAARQALAPETQGERLQFYLTEILVLAQKPAL